jgi:hypothetical protein
MGKSQGQSFLEVSKPKYKTLAQRHARVGTAPVCSLALPPAAGCFRLLAFKFRTLRRGIGGGGISTSRTTSSVENQLCDKQRDPSVVL